MVSLLTVNATLVVLPIICFKFQGSFPKKRTLGTPSSSKAGLNAVLGKFTTDEANYILCQSQVENNK